MTAARLAGGSDFKPPGAFNFGGKIPSGTGGSDFPQPVPEGMWGSDSLGPPALPPQTSARMPLAR